MASSLQQQRRASQLLLLAAVSALFLLIAAGSASADDRRGCNPGWVACGGKCVDPKTNPYHCNGCYRPCKIYPNTVAKCNWGVCSWYCQSGYGNCDGNIKNGCKTKLGSIYHCSKCHDYCKLSDHYKYGEVKCSGGYCKSQCKPGWKHNEWKGYCYKDGH